MAGILNLTDWKFFRAYPETALLFIYSNSQISDILKLIIAEGQPFNWGKVYKPQKASLHALRDV